MLECDCQWCGRICPAERIRRVYNYEHERYFLLCPTCSAVVYAVRWKHLALYLIWRAMLVALVSALAIAILNAITKHRFFIF